MSSVRQAHCPEQSQGAAREDTAKMAVPHRETRIKMARFKTQNSKLKTTARPSTSSGLRWLLGFLLLIVILWLVFVLAGRALSHIAVGQIAEFTNTKIRAKSIDFNLDGSVFIEKLVISPYKKQNYDDTILKAETLYARFSKVSLLLLRPRLKEIEIDDFVFNAQYNLDAERWNVSAFKIKPRVKGGGEMPIVNLERGKLQYSKVSNGEVKVVAEVPVDMRFGPAEKKQDAYSFDITTAKLASGFGKSHLRGFYQPPRLPTQGGAAGSITFAGGISSADILHRTPDGAALEMAWIIEVLAAELKYDQKDYSLKLSIKDFHSRRSPSLDKLAVVAPSFLQKSGLYAALQRFFNRYRPAGCTDIKLEALGSLNRLGESKLSGKIYCKDVSICDRKFQYPIEHLTGQIDFTEKSALLNNLSGQHGDVKLFFNGFSRDFGPNWKYEIRMTSDNMVLDNDLYDALSEKQKEFWSAFSPAGQVAIDYRLSRTPADKKKSLVVELLGTEATYRHFPYPLKNLAGKLFFDRDGITFSDVVSQVNERKIVVNGKAITAGPVPRRGGAGAGKPIYDVTIDVSNIPLDSTLELALPEAQRQLYAQFRPAGLADGEIKVFTPALPSGMAKSIASLAPASPDASRGSGQEAAGANLTSPPYVWRTSFIADLSFRESSLDSIQIPLAVSDISAKAVFTNDLIRIDSFTGWHAGGLLCLTGQAWPDEKGDLRYTLKLDARGAQLGEQLFDLLPKPLEKIVSEFQPEGKINYKADLNKTDPNDDYPDYNIAVTCLGDSINYKWFAYPLKDITGNLTITGDSIKLRDIVATTAEGLHIEPDVSTLKINGEVVLADNVFSNGWFELSARNILFDEQLGIALPESRKGFYSQLSPTGRFDVNSFGIKVSSDENGEKYIDFDGTVKFKDCNFDVPAVRLRAHGRGAAITGLDAELKTKGFYKTGEGFQWGEAILGADSIRIEGKAFTKLETDIYYDPDRQSWFTENLVADCYGGRLIGKLEFKQPAKAPSEYLLQADFENVDIKQFLSDTTDETRLASYKPSTTGKMNGSLGVSGQSGDSSSRIGRCKLAISDMQVGGLSPLAELLQVLKLTEPKDYAFDRMLIDSYIRRDTLLFEKFDLAGSAIAFYGSGQMDLQSKNVKLILNARGERLTTADPSILQSLAEGLGVAVVRMEVSGNVYDPQVKTKALPVIEDSLRILGTKKPELP